MSCRRCRSGDNSGSGSSNSGSGGGEGVEGGEGGGGSGKSGGASSSEPDTDSDGGDIEAEPDEVVVADFDAASLAQAAALGFEIKERRRLAHLGIEVTVFQLPLGLDAGTGRERLAALSPGAAIDLNHFYTPQATLRPPARKYAADMIGWGTAPKGCGQGLRIGIIDTPIDLNHRAFQGRRVEARSFVRRPGGISPSDHGTAVAALLVGNDRVDRHAGLLPGAQLFAANIFELRKGRMRANALSVASALDWLTGEGVRVVNLSLSGPPNRLLAQAVAHAARNMILVAAAGNAGANGRARYPAAYPDVLAVTATDSQLRPYGRANRGAYIDVAAPGVGIWTAATNLRGRYESGTSFAVPFVTAAVAALMVNGESVTVPEIRKIFARTALDLACQPVRFGLVDRRGRSRCKSQFVRAPQPLAGASRCARGPKHDPGRRRRKRRSEWKGQISRGLSRRAGGDGDRLPTQALRAREPGGLHRRSGAGRRNMDGRDEPARTL